MKQITVRDVWCPKCEARPGEPCWGAPTHRQRFYVARRVRYHLGLPQKRVLQNEWGQFRAAKR